ncbi:MAG: hypothetical protein HYU28_04195 [Actinobacteria bacterium]|nr:hypothetical protein [Actinomycetota bacterium]
MRRITRHAVGCPAIALAITLAAFPTLPAGAAEVPDLSQTYHDVNEIHDQIFPHPNPNEFRCRGLAPVANHCWKDFNRQAMTDYRVDVIPGGTFVGEIDAYTTDSAGNVAHKHCVISTPFTGSCEVLSHPSFVPGQFRIEGFARPYPGLPGVEGEFVAIVEFAPPE